ncbi:MAG: hypothetical protein ACSLE9_00905 [Burkholderiaceae bacterium]
MGATDHPAFAETEMANIVGLHRHAPDATSMLREPDGLDQHAHSDRVFLDVAERITQAYRNGLTFGRTEGFREGFQRGTHWGMVCGACLAGLLAAIGIILAGVGLGHRLPL